MTFRRALAEAAVIVLGILVALAADAWLDGVGERRRESEYLVALEADLHVLKGSTEQLIEAAHEVQQAGAQLLSVAAMWPIASVSADSIASLIRGIGYEFDWSPEVSTYEDLLNTGAVQTLRSDGVRLGLVSVTNRSRIVTTQVGNHNRYFWASIEPYLRQKMPILSAWHHPGLPQPETAWEPSSLLASLEFRNLIAGKSLVALDVENRAARLLDAIEEVLALVVMGTETASSQAIATDAGQRVARAYRARRIIFGAQ